MDKVYKLYNQNTNTESNYNIREHRYETLKVDTILRCFDSFDNILDATVRAQELCNKTTDDYVVIQVVSIIRPNISANTTIIKV